MSDVMPPPVHLDEVVEGLAGNPALPTELVRRLFSYRNGYGSVAKRPDLTDDMIAEIIAADDDWLTHALALNRSLPYAFRMTLAEHPDPGIRAAAWRARTARPASCSSGCSATPTRRCVSTWRRAIMCRRICASGWRPTRSRRSGRRSPNGGREPRKRCAGSC